MPSSLTTRDISILEKIKDPEAGLSAPLLISSELPRDPHMVDPIVYQAISQQERSIITSIQSVELQLAGLKSGSAESPLNQYLECVKSLDDLVASYPKYASARNNRAQALRRIYGDDVLVKSSLRSKHSVAPLEPDASDLTLLSVSTTTLSDLTEAIALLTPSNVFSPISPQAAKTLSQAYTQRGAIYLQTAKRLAVEDAELRMASSRREAEWTSNDFEENASKDFRLGGMYGNEIAKALAVSTNPTAKLCGEMVKEAMKKEYSGASV